MEILDQPMATDDHYNFDEKVKSLLNNGYDFDLGGYISKGHKILMADFGRFLGYELLVFLISIVLGLIPLVGSLANFVIGNSLFMGFAIFARRIYLNRPRSFNNFFDGFKLLGPLFLLRLLSTILIAVIAIPYVLITMGSFFMNIIRERISSSGIDYDMSYILSNFAKLIPLVFIVIIIAVLLGLSTYIVTFGRKGAVDGMTLSMKLVAKRFFAFVLFFIVIGLINIGGALALGLGLLYTIPLSLCSVYAAYESIVGTNPNDEVLDKQV